MQAWRWPLQLLAAHGSVFIPKPNPNWNRSGAVASNGHARRPFIALCMHEERSDRLLVPPREASGASRPGREAHTPAH